MQSRFVALGFVIAACHHAAPGGSRAPTAPASIELPGKPNGLFWDATAHRLVIADDEHGKLLAWRDPSDAGGAGALTELADLGADGGLGQPVLLPDGSWLVTRFGEGSAGSIVRAPGGIPPLSGLAPERRRIGLAARGDVVIDAWFVRGKGVAKAGGVAQVIVTAEGATERDLLTGLGKPVGVAIVGDHVYASDQEAGTILETSLAAPGAPTVHARVDKPDLLAVGDDGALYTVDGGGVLERIDGDGSVHAIARDLDGARGVAFDGEGRRVFVAVRGKGGPSRVVIVALPAAPR